MTRADMDAVRDQFVAAVRMGLEAGFDMVELHAAHGYLLSSFITPLQNKRTDEYGGSLDNRLRYPLEVFAAMRAAWPSRPADVGAHLGHRLGRRRRRHARRGGRDRAKPSRATGADLIDVSAGQTWADAQPVYGRMFQTPVQRQDPQRGAGSRPWRSATSTSPTTPIRSSPPAAPTSSRSPGRI